MLDEKTIEELHSYYDRLPGGICLVKADDSEEILLANAELLNYYQCANWQEFKELDSCLYRVIHNIVYCNKRSGTGAYTRHC